MRIEVLGDAVGAASAAARWLAAEARSAVAARGRFTFAVSGGRTPWTMLRMLATRRSRGARSISSRWTSGSRPRGTRIWNLTHVEECLLSRVELPPGNVHAMPVEEADLERAAAAYARELAAATDGTGALDVVHLGLGRDGHTASLPPCDPEPDRSGGAVGSPGPTPGGGA